MHALFLTSLVAVSALASSHLVSLPLSSTNFSIASRNFDSLFDLDYDLDSLKPPSLAESDAYEPGFWEKRHMSKRAANALPPIRHALTCHKTSQCRERNAFRAPHSSYRCPEDHKCSYECNTGYKPKLTYVHGSPVYICVPNPEKCGSNACARVKDGIVDCVDGQCKYSCFADTPDRKYRLRYVGGQPYCVDLGSDVDNCGGYGHACPRPYPQYEGLVSCHAGVCHAGCNDGSKPKTKHGVLVCS